MSTSIFTLLRATASLPLFVSDVIWNALLSLNEICWEQHFDLIESKPKKFSSKSPAAKVHGHTRQLQSVKENKK